MKARVAIGAIVFGIAVPLAMTAAIVWWLSRGGDDAAPPSPSRPPATAVKGFNAEGLPPVHLDACPSGAELLPEPVTGSDALPDVTLDCIGEIGSADKVALRRLGGVPTVVNLWASWCDPCRREMPDLQDAYAAAAGRVRFLGINTGDSPEGARATIANTQVRYPSLADPASRVRDGVGSIYMPTTLFVGADGRIAHRRAGFMTAEQVRQLISEHLGVAL